MATKQEIYESVAAEVLKVLDEAKVANKHKDAIKTVFDEHLAPKTAGMRVNLDEVTVKNDEGVVESIKCSLSGAWLEATLENFYEDKSANPTIVGIDGVGLKRVSRQAEAIRKQHLKTIAASERAIMSDVLEGVITPEAGKEKLTSLKETKPDYSTVGATEDSEA